MSFLGDTPTIPVILLVGWIALLATVLMIAHWALKKADSRDVPAILGGLANFARVLGRFWASSVSSSAPSPPPSADPPSLPGQPGEER